MRNLSRVGVFAFFLIATSFLAGCGAMPPQAAPAKGPKAEPNVIAFTGTVEAMNGTKWTISGQEFTIAPQASPNPKIAVGDKVNVEATVFARDVVATKIQLSAKRAAMIDTLSDAISTLTPSDISPLDTSSHDIKETTQEMAAHPEDSLQPPANASEQEVFGTVEAITADTITVAGVTYDLTNSTEIKDTLAAGEAVELHVTVNADGTVAVREIEKSTASFGGNDNKSNGNPSNDSPNHDSNNDRGGNSGSGKSGSGG